MKRLRPMYVVLPIALLLLAYVGFLVFYGAILSEIALPGQISDTDWVVVDDKRIKAGDNLAGRRAPIEDFIKVFEVGNRGESTVDSWINENAEASYFIPLFDESGEVVSLFIAVRTVDSWINKNAEASYFIPLFDESGEIVNLFIAVRTSSNTFSAWENEWVLEEYVAAKERLKAAGFVRASYRIFNVIAPEPMYILCGEIDGSVYGVMFAYRPSGVVCCKNWSQFFDSELYLGKIMTEEELVYLFETLQQYRCGFWCRIGF